jgi:hypothetical protein
MNNKWSSNDKNQLIFENFRKFMKEGEFSPVVASSVKDFILGGKMEKRKYSNIPVYVLARVVRINRKDLEKMTKEDGIEEIVKLMNTFDEDGSVSRATKGKKLSDIMKIREFVEWYLDKKKEEGQKLVNFTDDEMSDDEMSDEELYKDIL